jgi:hypothetical protein
MLVSIGVSYWQIGEKERALALTQKGVNLVEEAVNAGVLSRTTLSVPYGNLATMYEKVGETTSAAKYANLAKSASGQQSPAPAPQRVGRTNTVRQTSGASGTSAGRPRQDRMMR